MAIFLLKKIHRLILQILAVILFLTKQNLVHASNFTLDSLTPQDIDSISKELSANFMHSSVSPAASLGKIFGFEAGAIAGLTQTPDIAKVIKKSAPNEDIDQLPHGGAFFQFSFPFGITAEALSIPSLKIDNFKLSTISGGVKITYTEYPNFKWIPFDAAIRPHFNLAKLSYSDTINNSTTANQDVNAKIELTNKMWGIDVLVSKNLLLLSPYIGMGYLGGISEVGLEGSGQISIFDQTTPIASQQSVKARQNSFRAFGGVELNLFLMHLALEYMTAFGTSRISGKVVLSI